MLCLLLCIAHVTVFAQSPAGTGAGSNLRKKWIPLKSDTIQLDTLSLVPKTVSILAVPDSLYKTDFVNGYVVFRSRPAFDSVLVTYRVFPGKMNAIPKHVV